MTSVDASENQDGWTTARIVAVVLGTSLVIGAFTAPWWTRGMDFDPVEEETNFPPGMQGQYYHYGPFVTPGDGQISFDASREGVVALLGVLGVATVGFLVASVLVRWAARAGRVGTDSNAPVRLSILAFLTGTAAVLIGGLFVPLLGQDPGFLWGDEDVTGTIAEQQGATEFFETTRYGNAGFFLGILAFVALPAFAWADAATVRALSLEALPETERRQTSGTAS